VGQGAQAQAQVALEPGAVHEALGEAARLVAEARGHGGVDGAAEDGEGGNPGAQAPDRLLHGLGGAQALGNLEAELGPGGGDLGLLLLGEGEGDLDLLGGGDGVAGAQEGEGQERAKARPAGAAAAPCQGHVHALVHAPLGEERLDPGDGRAGGPSLLVHAPPRDGRPA
jgi:hypothetical protein